MRSIISMDNIQIEITNACIRSCSNCTRFCGHQKPYFMDLDYFKKAVDSMEGYPKMVGFMGGEPLLHPKFEEMCNYALSKIPRERLGLWTCLPPGLEKYRRVICNTFGNIFINDHSRSDIYHAPILVGSEEVFPDKKQLFFAIDSCWLQNSWSASINPKGCFFCEIAASMSLLFGTDKAWPLEPGWWWRTPKDFTEQIEEYCPKCGISLPFPRRCSLEDNDDISPLNLARLKGKSIKVAGGKFHLSDLKIVKNPEPMAAYKDTAWRNKVAARYGIHLTINEKHFWNPVLLTKPLNPPKRTFAAFKEAYDAAERRKVEGSVCPERSGDGSGV